MALWQIVKGIAAFFVFSVILGLVCLFFQTRVGGYGGYVLLSGIVVWFGAVGGIINAFITDNGFLLPKQEQSDGNTILRPGVLGNALVGAVAGYLFWLAFGTTEVKINWPFPVEPQPVTWDGKTVAGALGAGIGGAKWLSSYVDKQILKETAVAAAQGQPSPVAANRIRDAKPAGALEIARGMDR